MDEWFEHPREFYNPFPVLGYLEPAPEPKIITMEEFKQHNSKESLWMEINGKVYDLTTVLRWHPFGPEPLLAFGGADASGVFNYVHPLSYLGHFDPIAVIDPSSKKEPVPST